jgi:hypothetical protein
MKRAITAAGLLIALMLVTTCSSVSIRTDFDAEASFDAYESFAWFERPDRSRRKAKPSPLVERRIEREVKSALEAKGYQEASPRRADILVTYHTSVRDKVRVTHTGYTYPRRWRRGWGWGTTHVHHYREGSLVVDIIDRRDRELVWRGVAQGAFSTADPSDERVRKVVTKLLVDFPPQ